MLKKDQLLSEIQKAVKKSIIDQQIGIAFSGGVDSTLISKICTDLGYDVCLLTIGFSDSHDILFAKDVNNYLNYPHKIFEIDHNTFYEIASKINKKINTENLSWNENCIAFYYVAKLAHSLGIKTVVTANGIDELFCGYNAYREAIEEGEEKVLAIERKEERRKEMMLDKMHAEEI